MNEIVIKWFFFIFTKIKPILIKVPCLFFFLFFFFLTDLRSQSSPKLFPNWRTLFSSKPKNSKLFIMKTLFCLKLKKRIRGFDWEFSALWIYPNYLFLTIPSNWSPLQDQNKCLWYFPNFRSWNYFKQQILQHLHIPEIHESFELVMGYSEKK